MSESHVKRITIPDAVLKLFDDHEIKPSPQGLIRLIDKLQGQETIDHKTIKEELANIHGAIQTLQKMILLLAANSDAEKAKAMENIASLSDQEHRE